ncbi:fumarase, class II [Abditibacterium utsteinense]|uniref:Fumarate hydratase class II n=2 Tax=Abditibacterium utsteinense TaxID=1960156 RepID=A0A2S8SWH9_9BACT|nr:class II fumarate hydratase [Abditibacterium utsteinense]PQV65161.1 fumarase, class II [Abditibacterium utsteinense]
MEYRIERDSMGEMQVPQNALYAAQTQRAVENFPISGLTFPRSFIKALAVIKGACALVNADLELLPRDKADAIRAASIEVSQGNYDDQFPIDIFQTGSGTSTNMNANEVLASLASSGELKIHPNDDVNSGQSSNDVIPTAIHVAASMEIADNLLPSLRHLLSILHARAEETKDVVKTGRTHLMDAMPITLGQEIGAWGAQIEQSIERILQSLPRLQELAIGGTAVGTGINAHPEFGNLVARKLEELTHIPFRETRNHFAAQATLDAATEMSGQLKTLATALFKISNDLRWMNSGPQGGLSEIVLPSLQPGSSIMPGKINPVIPEATMQVAAQVVGNDATIALCNASGNFQLNVMLPIAAYNLLQSITLLGNVSRVLADKAIAGFEVKSEKMLELVDKNPIMVTVLNPLIGYEKGAALAKQAYKEGRTLKDLALEQTDLSAEELETLLDAKEMTKGGIKGSGGGG